MDSTRGLPLAGLVVVSVEQAVAAPYATRQLADLGAGHQGGDAATLRGRRPELVHCSVFGYGEDGPYAAKKAYGLLI